MVLFPLFAELTTLDGIGPRTASLYARLCGGARVLDLLWHLPVGIVDRRYAPSLVHADKDRVVTITVQVIEHQKPARRSKPYKIIATDGTDQVTITYFNAKGDYLESLYPLQQTRVISGLLERFFGVWTMAHPDYVMTPARAAEIPMIEPVYPLTAGLGGKSVRRAVAAALRRVPALEEWHDDALLAREKWPAFSQALSMLHQPVPDADPAQQGRARARLAYDEMLADQLALSVIRAHRRHVPGTAMPGTGRLVGALMQQLPFALTAGQRDVVDEIAADMAAPRRMLRLLQGDVGSGKTIVALIAMLRAVESGAQAALMAPTEILAKQHHAKLQQFLKPLGLDIGLLTGRGRGQGGARQKTLAALQSGALQMVVGTHALFQDDVSFAALGLAVVDEQHRFGVEQRLALSDKGRGVDVLVMTATPIPRTLTLTAYGDMDVSRLIDKPPGRTPIDTRLIDGDRIGDVIAALRRHIDKGGQAYWVCPLVAESEKLDLAAATERATMLRAALGDRNVGLVHGQMKTEEKDAAMADFINGTTKLLVATTVIEVGVDVPAASLMIIEHSERFGLAPLHQLRGRVGRGAAQSVCLLMYQKPLGPMARDRLQTLRDTEDGFRIAEEDLRLRGPGEILGTRQSGLTPYRLADIAQDKDMLDWARKDADLILNKDPDLASPRGAALRHLLYLFEKDAAVRLFRAG